MVKGNNFARQNAKLSESSGSGSTGHTHANSIGIGAGGGRLHEMVDVGRVINSKAIGRTEEYAWQEEEEDINKSADEFISRFRQNLRLQRLQSIENYKQMLARGL